MRKVAFGILTAAAAVVLAPAAHAAKDEIVLGPAPSSDFYGENSLVGGFESIFNFNLTGPGSLDFGISSSSLDLSEVVLNTTSYTSFTGGGGSEGGLFGQSVSGGPQTLIVRGTGLGAGGSFGGAVSFVAEAIPEAGTWILMIVGFGMAGYSLRRRRFGPVNARIAYA